VGWGEDRSFSEKSFCSARRHCRHRCRAVIVARFDSRSTGIIIERRNISVLRAREHSACAWVCARRARAHAPLVHNDDAVSTRRGCSFSLRQIRKRIINTGDPGSMITRINSRMDELCSRSALSLSSQREGKRRTTRDRRKRGRSTGGSR
jgi:hypothetical protein